jgi:hypothetical protein
MVSVVEVLLLILVRVTLGELFAICVHSRVVLITTFVTNTIFVVWLSCIKEDTSCILNFLINVCPFFLLVMNRPLLLLRSKIGHDFSLFKFIHHISTVILRWLRIDLLLQYFYLLFKYLYFKLQDIILFTCSFITRFYNNLLNIEMLAISRKNININIIASFTTIASGDFGSFGCA